MFINYLMSGLDHQADDGFGINADAFKEAADYLSEQKGYNDQFLPQKHMPVFFLYRHVIELYFKSMIILIHSELNIPYGSSGNSKPQILTQKGERKPIDNCHWIDALFWYWSKLLKERLIQLKEQAPKGSWEIHPELEGNIKRIADYDKDSTFFRYPSSKKTNNQKDKEKYSMKEVSSLEDYFQKTADLIGSITFLIQDDNNEINTIYSLDDNVLDDLLTVFRETADILENYHIMTRLTLSGGY